MSPDAPADPTPEELLAAVEADPDLLDPRPPRVPLWPQRFGRRHWATQRAAMGSWLAAAMMDQRPVPLEGGLFKGKWFLGRHRRLEKGDGWKLSTHPDACLDSLSWRFTVVDPATGKTALTDPTAVVTFAVSPWAHLLVLDVVSERVRLEELPGLLKTVWGAWKPGFVAVEANGFQIQVVRECRRVLPHVPFREVQPEGRSKFVRSVAARARAEEGKILLPDPEPKWLGKFLEELCNWTGSDGERDDVVDCCSYGAELMGSGMAAGAEAVEPDPQPDRGRQGGGVVFRATGGGRDRWGR